MNIVFLLKSLTAGGVERITLSLSSLLVARGHTVTLAVMRNEGALAGEIPPGVQFFELERRSSALGRLMAFRAGPGSVLQLARPVLLAAKTDRSLSYLGSLIRLFGERQPDAIVAATPYANLLAVWARRLSKLQSRVLVMEHVEISKYLKERTGWRHRYLLPLMGRCYAGADVIGAVSGGVADDLAHSSGLSRELIRVVYNPVVTDELTGMSNEAVAHPWFADDSVETVLSVGRLADQKDHATLLRAFAKARKQRELRLVILGSAGSPEKTRERQDELMCLARELGVEQDVWLPGFVSNPYAYMSKADVFALSSLYEGLPTVLVEAMACGCPVVSTACPGAVEILQGGKFGKIAPIGDVDKLAESILSTLDEGMDRTALLNRSQRFSAERAAAEYESILAGDRVD